jgi:hypothetical protein
MPIAHVHMPEQGILLPKRDMTADFGQLSILLAQQGGVLDVGRPNEITDITPPYWNDGRGKSYFLEMKGTPNAAKVHIIQRDPDRPIVALAHIAASSALGEVIHIPAQQWGVAIIRAHKGKPHAEIAGAVFYLASQEELDLYRSIVEDTP